MAARADRTLVPERRPGGHKLFVATFSLVYSYLTLFVVLVCVCGVANDFVQRSFEDLFSFATRRALMEMRDQLMRPLSAVLGPLGAVPGGTFLQIALPVALNAFVFIRSLKIMRGRLFAGRGWRALNGYLLVLSFACLGASFAFVGLFLTMLLAFGLVDALGAR